jgi:catechol 2,3-dioxygenase-like lactoylglutathione lyase family enzyme
VTTWFARAVLHVRDVAASSAYYVDRLGFAKAWSYDEDGTPAVAQVERQGCALILSRHWPDKVGKALMFVSLNADTPDAQTAALDALRAELETRGVAVKDGSWGYRVLVVEDPDGNQLYFNYPNV